MQRATKPSPCAQPNSIVSVSKPGSSQNTIRPAKIASSTQESRFTQTNSRPGTGFSNGRAAIAAQAPGVSAVSTMRSCSSAWAPE